MKLTESKVLEYGNDVPFTFKVSDEKEGSKGPRESPRAGSHTEIKRAAGGSKPRSNIRNGSVRIRTVELPPDQKGFGKHTPSFMKIKVCSAEKVK